VIHGREQAIWFAQILTSTIRCLVQWALTSTISYVIVCQRATIHPHVQINTAKTTPIVFLMKTTILDAFARRDSEESCVKKTLMNVLLAVLKLVLVVFVLTK